MEQENQLEADDDEEQAEQSDGWASVSEAASLTGAALRSVYNNIASKKLPTRTNAAGHTLVEIAALKRLIASKNASNRARQHSELASAEEGQEQAEAPLGARSGGRSSPEVQAAREELEMMRLEAEKERLAQQIEVARAARARAARQAQADEEALAYERSLRQTEIETASRRSALALDREADALAAEQRARQVAESRPDREAREATARMRWTSSWLAGVRQCVTKQIGEDAEILGQAFAAARRVLEGLAVETNDSLVEPLLVAEVAPLFAPIRLQRERAALVDEVTRKLPCWFATEGPFRARWVTREMYRRVLAVIEDAAAEVDPVRDPGACEKVRRAAMDAVAEEEAAEQERERQKEAAEAAELEGRKRAEVEQEWSRVRARIPTMVALWLPNGVRGEDLARATEAAFRLLDERAPGLAPSHFEADAKVRLAPLRIEIEHRTAVDRAISGRRNASPEDEAGWRQAASDAVARSGNLGWEGLLDVADGAVRKAAAK